MQCLRLTYVPNTTRMSPFARSMDTTGGRVRLRPRIVKLPRFYRVELPEVTSDVELRAEQSEK